VKNTEEHEAMAEHQRLRREDPKRTSPIRNWSTLYRSADSWGKDDPATQPAAEEGTNPHSTPLDAVSHGVTLGYQVIEEHLQQGRRIAEQINNRSYNVKGAGNDVRGLIEQLMRDSVNILSLWFNLLSSFTGNPDLVRQFSRSDHKDPSSPEREAFHQTTPPVEEPTPRDTTVSVEIRAHGPTQVTVNLSPQAEQLFLATPGLHAMSAEKPPLTDITFLPGLDGNPAQLRIHVPQGHPPDLYTGVLVDRTTGLPQGTLSVRIAD
jgi:hypothetical protein